MILFLIISFVPTHQFMVETIVNSQTGRSLNPVDNCLKINCGEIDRSLELSIETRPGCKVLDVIPIEELMLSAYLTHEKTCTVPHLSSCDNDHCVERNRNRL